MTFPCIKCKIHKYTITQIRKYTNTKCLKDPTCAIFFKSMGFKDSKLFLFVSCQKWALLDLCFQRLPCAPHPSPPPLEF